MCFTGGLDQTHPIPRSDCPWRPRLCLLWAATPPSKDTGNSPLSANPGQRPSGWGAALDRIPEMPVSWASRPGVRTSPGQATLGRSSVSVLDIADSGICPARKSPVRAQRSPYRLLAGLPRHLRRGSSPRSSSARSATSPTRRGEGSLARSRLSRQARHHARAGPVGDTSARATMGPRGCPRRR
jgi:hypothetical protein